LKLSLLPTPPPPATMIRARLEVHLAGLAVAFDELHGQVEIV
jgi:hypothetical protein